MKRKKLLYVGVFVVIFLILIYFRVGFFRGLSYTTSIIFRPFIKVGHSVGGTIGSFGSYFNSKRSLSLENEDLRLKLAENNARMLNHNSILSDDASLKEILGRKDENKSLVLSAILAKPNQSFYDTLLVDAGSNQGINVGNMVFAFGDVPLGRVSDVYPSSSKVVLFSTSGEKTQVVVGEKNTFMEIVGRGGGNFEMIVPRDLTILKGDTAVLPGIIPRVVGIVETIISDPRDSFTKALLVSPVNMQELKFVQVEIK